MTEKVVLDVKKMSELNLIIKTMEINHRVNISTNLNNPVSEYFEGHQKGALYANQTYTQELQELRTFFESLLEQSDLMQAIFGKKMVEDVHLDGSENIGA